MTYLGVGFLSKVINFKRYGLLLKAPFSIFLFRSEFLYLYAYYICFYIHCVHNLNICKMIITISLARLNCSETNWKKQNLFLFEADVFD